MSKEYEQILHKENKNGKKFTLKSFNFISA